jgi:hypothetical protein
MPRDLFRLIHEAREDRRLLAALLEDVDTALSIHRIQLSDKETTDLKEAVEKIRRDATGLFAHLVATTTGEMGLGALFYAI